MMPSKKKIKKILIILALLFVNAWFWGNAALEYDIYDFCIEFEFEGKEYENCYSTELKHIPDKLTLTEADIDGKYLYFYTYKMKIPFINDESLKIHHGLTGRQFYKISLSVGKSGSGSQIGLYNLSNIDDNDSESLFSKIIALIYGEVSEDEYVEKLYYTRPSDMSWWNLRENLRIREYLTVKVELLPSGRRYDVTTPHVRGFLIEGAAYDSFHFVLDGRRHFIFLTGPPEFSSRNLIGTIRPIENVDEAYNEIEALYHNNLGYPEELLILSMISLKGPVENYHKQFLIKKLKRKVDFYEELLKVEDKEDNKKRDRKLIQEIRSDIEYFENSME
jgi:hypothetical protein